RPRSRSAMARSTSSSTGEWRKPTRSRKRRRSSGRGRGARDPLPMHATRSAGRGSFAATVILSEAKDLKLRILRSFAVSVAQDDVSFLVSLARSVKGHGPEKAALRRDGRSFEVLQK